MDDRASIRVSYRLKSLQTNFSDFKLCERRQRNPTEYSPVWPFPRVFSNRYGPTYWWFSVVVVLFSFCMFIVSVPFTFVWVADRLAYPWVPVDYCFRLLQDSLIRLYSNLIILYDIKCRRPRNWNIHKPHVDINFISWIH